MGGHAFDNISPVTIQEFLLCNLHIVEKLKASGITRWQYVGTTGKKPVMGDIDIAVEFNGTRDELMKNLTQIGIDHKNMRKFGSNMVSINWDLYDNDTKRIQVDVMIGDIHYLSWSRYADPTLAICASARNLLLSSWNRFNSIGTNKLTEQFVLDWERGLMKARRTKLGKDGCELKAWKTIESTFVASNANIISQTLFGNWPNGYPVSAADTMTFESVVNTLSATRDYTIVEQFFRSFLKELPPLIEQTPHLLGPSPNKMIGEIDSLFSRVIDVHCRLKQ